MARTYFDTVLDEQIPACIDNDFVASMYPTVTIRFNNGAVLTRFAYPSIHVSLVLSVYIPSTTQIP
jgi:hypothetical protein